MERDIDFTKRPPSHLPSNLVVPALSVKIVTQQGLRRTGISFKRDFDVPLDAPDLLLVLRLALDLIFILRHVFQLRLDIFNPVDLSLLLLHKLIEVVVINLGLLV